MVGSHGCTTAVVMLKPRSGWVRRCLGAPPHCFSVRMEGGTSLSSQLPDFNS